VIPGSWFLTPGPWSLITTCLYAAFLLAVLVIDLEHRRVLNVMVAPAAVVALLLSFLPGGPTPVQALIGGALGFGVFFLLALIGRGAMGLGDVKLAGVIGLMTGYPLVVAALALGIVLGGIAAIALLVTRRAGRKGTMAYAPYLALGTIIVLLL
jgi:leader peptidase (prepilin peptidase) / N-methyltransferase